jgi:hypothetical protein
MLGGAFAFIANTCNCLMVAQTMAPESTVLLCLRHHPRMLLHLQVLSQLKAVAIISTTVLHCQHRNSSTIGCQHPVPLLLQVGVELVVMRSRISVISCGLPLELLPQSDCDRELFVNCSIEA